MRTYEEVLSALDLSIPKTASFQDMKFEDVKNENVKQELLLIQRVQKNNDFLAEQQLIALYRGLLTKLVNKSPAIATAGYDAVYTRATNALKSAIRKYSLENYNKNQPSTYFTASIEGELKKINDSASTSAIIKMPENLALYKKDIAMAQKTLEAQLGREPSAMEIYNYIKNEMKKGGKGLTVASIERVLNYDTKELSGSRTISNENASGAEALTYGEVFGHNESIEDKYKEKLQDENIVRNIQEFTQDKQKRRLLMQMLGVGGEFGGKPARTLSEAAFNNGLTYHTAKNTLSEFKDFAAKKGLI